MPTPMQGSGDVYSLRRVNPFQGLVSVVRTPGGRALSVDGVHWQIQVLAHPPRGLWSGGGDRPERAWFRFGYWSDREGTTRVPLNPIFDAGSMIQESRRLVERVRESMGSLPFPLAPELEQWLLDGSAEPLALLATALPGTDLSEVAATDWTAGGRTEARPFVSATLAAQGVPERDASGRRPHVERLERLIAQAAGPRRNARWFRRDAAEAVALDREGRLDPAVPSLPNDAFPPLTLRTAWPSESASRLVDDYIAWLSPYLLTLPGLGPETRRDLERQAARYALLVDAVWRLYPGVQDADLIERVRVEARLRRAARPGA